MSTVPILRPSATHAFESDLTSGLRGGSAPLLIASFSPIPIQWQVAGIGEHFPKELGIHLFRIVQEYVKHVAKHPRTATCEVIFASRRAGPCSRSSKTAAPST
jgi:signal transduction histidine kinase